MSETPHTPPPPEPPPAGSGQPMASFNADQMKSAVQGAHKYDLGIIAAGLLAFIFSLFSYYTVSFSGALGIAGASGSESAWHGFFGWFAALVALAVSVLLALRLLGVKLLDASMTRLVALGGFGVATLCVLLALLVWPGKVSASGIDYGHGIGYWVSLVVIVAGLVLSFLRKDAKE